MAVRQIKSPAQSGVVNEFLRLSTGRSSQTFRTLALVALGPILVILTYLALGPLDLGGGTTSVRLVLLVDLIYVLIVAALILRGVLKLIMARRAGSAGSQLHLRLTSVFTLLALVPTVLVAVFAVITLNFGLEGWFSDRVRNVVGSSLAAAEAYKKEQNEALVADAQSLSEYLVAAKLNSNFLSDGDLIPVLSQAQGLVQRGLKEAYIIDGAGEIKARGDRSYLFGFERPLPNDFEAAASGEAIVIEDWTNNEFRALLKLAAYNDRYIYIGRTVDGNILNLLDETKETVRLYQQLENDRGRLLFEFGLVYLGFALILILAATWLGLWFAERLSRPVGQLAGAAQRVGAGDLDVQVKEAKGNDEIAMLGRLFNQMTRQLRGQRQTLLDNTAQIERRRRLFDSVLSSVSAGVIGLDAQGHVTFMNRAAHRLLDLKELDYSDATLQSAVPEFADLFEVQLSNASGFARAEVKITRRGQLESLLVRMATRLSDEGALEGYVIAFDDVTELVSAQKMAAWGDVARRIAHEIKNPLTPIQLSAESIKRKFRESAGDQSDLLDQYTDVIVRQTDDLRRIVDEFSKFARMPEPELRETELVNLVNEAVLLQKSGQPDVDITFECGLDQVYSNLDKTMIGQALTNLIKNAGEAIETASEKGVKVHHPRIRVSLAADNSEINLKIADNGIGLPDDRTRLFEPYVTTRDKGTGLGLPIVKKIIEEHGGILALRNAEVFEGEDHFGAEAEIKLPRFVKNKKKVA